MANITYKKELISSNSEAYKLHQDKNFKALDKHLKELDNKQAELIRYYDQKLAADNKKQTEAPDP